MQLDRWARAGINRINHVHFIGIGGSGMSGLAEILAGLGYKVSGSDQQNSPTLKRLASLGVTCYRGHAAKNVKKADLVVRSSAIAANNVEIKQAQKNSVPIIQRAEMLADIMRFGFGIAVAGSHGKTTTTSMLATVLSQGGGDVTFIVGGILKHFKTNAKLGSGKYVVAEADESDGSFLFLRPLVAVVTNIDAEHISMYDGNMAKLKDTFLEFMQHIPFDGLVVICADDAKLRSLEKKINRPLVKYGFAAAADYRAKDVKQNHMETSFTMIFPDGEEREVLLRIPGKHNVLNAVASLAVAAELGVDRERAIAALEDFIGVARRQDLLGEFNGKGKDKRVIENVTLIDDYGHHPTEIETTLEALRKAWPGRRFVMLFQLHRYTRTKELWEEFQRVLAKPDQLLLLDIYAADEKPLPGISSARMAKQIKPRSGNKVIHIKSVKDLRKLLPELLQSNDILLTQGAGSIGRMAQNLAANNLYLRSL